MRSHPATLVLLVAFTIRFLFAVFVAVSKDGYLFPDDRGYLRMAAEFASGNTVNWDLFGTWGLWNVNAGFLTPISYLFHFFGFHPLLGQTLTALAGATTAAAVAALVHRHASAIAALFAGFAVAALPSQVLWSSIVLKDAYSWMALSLLALVLGWWANRSDLIGFLVGFLLLSSLTFFLAHLRVHTLTTACIAGTIAMLLIARRHRVAKVLAMLVLLAVMPLSVGAGFFSHNTFALTSNLGGIRSNMAMGARTAINQTFRPLPTLAPMTSQPTFAGDSPDALYGSWAARSDGDAPAGGDVGPTSTELKRMMAEIAAGWDYGDPRSEIPQSAVAEASWQYLKQQTSEIEQIRAELSSGGTTADIRYLPTGLRVMLLDPLPNHLGRSPNLKYPFGEHLLWYPLLILALVGVKARLKTLTPELVYTVFVTGGLAVMWALVEGNFGTAYRHRGELVWGVAVLAGIGLDHLLNNRHPTVRILSRSSASQDLQDTQQSEGVRLPQVQ